MPRRSDTEPEAITNPPPPPSRGGVARGLLRAARPRQWAKNVLVLAAPAAAGVLGDAATAGNVAAAFGAFCLAASGIYLVNDVLDASADRAHPRKQHRPIAAGLVPAGLAVTVGVGLLVAGLALSAVARSPALTATVGAYVLVTLAYSLWLKHVLVLDLVTVAAGFFLRAVAGGFAAGVPLSEWFLIVTWFGALFVVAGKRHAEHVALGEDRSTHRATLDAYTPAFTSHVLTVAAVATVLAYCLWAFETQATDGGGPWLAVSILPFTVAFLRYALLVFSGRGGEPEDLVLGDPGLLAAGAVWVAVLVPGFWLT